MNFTFERTMGHGILYGLLQENTVLGLCGKVFVAGGHRGGFCEKLLEASPMSDRANDSWLQDGPTAGQGRDHQQRW